MNRQIHAMTVVAILTALLWPPGLAASDRNEPPNVIFILTDDQRADQMDYEGDKRLSTPELASLAEEGVRFDHAFVNSAICTPSRVSFFLGQYERRHGINFNSGTSLAPEAWEASYPVRMQQAGYFTGYIGKNHVPLGPDGYDSGIMEDSFDFWYAGHGHLTMYPKNRHELFRDASHETQIEILGEATHTFLDPDHSFIDGARTFLDRRPQDQPFHLSVAFNVPHGATVRSMQQLEDDPSLYRSTYRDHFDELPIPETYIPKSEIAQPKLPADVLSAEHRQATYDYVDREPDLREHLVRQYQLINGVDRFVGSLREELERLGLAENTIIIFTSDHGLMLGEHGLGGKALNYDVCLRVPMIVYDPRLPEDRRGVRRSELIESVDVAPTMLDLGGVPIPDAMQGRSFVPLLHGESVDWREYAFAENLWSTYFGNPRIESVQDQRFKYIRYFATDRELFETDSPPYAVTPEQADTYASWLTASSEGLEPDHEELFDLANDPHESRNLADDPEHAERLEHLRGELDRLVREAKGNTEQPPLTIRLVDEVE